MRILERIADAAWRFSQVLLLLLATLGLGCAGSHSSIIATDASYPVSMSSVVYGPDGHLLDRKQLEEVGLFAYEYRSVHALFTLLPLRRTRHDLSRRIDEEVATAGGEAVVDLTVVAASNGWNAISAILGGILPAYSKVSVFGTIVRRLEEGTVAPDPDAGPTGDAP
jgi:hypothetical protein